MVAQLLINGKSGTVLSTGVEHCRALAASHFAGAVTELVGSPPQLIAAAAAAARDPSIDKVLLIGGDGTAAAIAGELAGTGTALAPLPGGTMNMLSRDLGYSGDLETAFKELATARIDEIDVAYMNDLPFLNNVVFGTFSRAAESREAIREAETIGETASATADFISAVAQSEAEDYVITMDGDRQHLHTNTFMVANNLYTGSELLRPTRERLNGGTLGVYLATATGAFDFLSVIYNAVSGQLAQAEGVTLNECRQCDVSSAAGRLALTVDGETVETPSPARFTIRPKALTVLRPA